MQLSIYRLHGIIAPFAPLILAKRGWDICRCTIRAQVLESRVLNTAECEPIGIVGILTMKESHALEWLMG